MFHVSTMLPYTANNTQQVQSTASCVSLAQLARFFLYSSSFLKCVAPVSLTEPCLCLFTLPCFEKGFVEKPPLFCSEHDIKYSAP